MTIKSAYSRNAEVRPEMEVLLCCARPEADEGAHDRLAELLEGRLDWPYLMRVAGLHGVIPMLYRRLRETARDRMPASILDELKLCCVHSAAHSTFLTEALLDLLRLFAEHGIEAVPLKGPVLAAVAYDDPAQRVFSDLDIMVRRRDVRSAVEVLTTEGYQPLSKSGPAKQSVRDLLQSRVHKDAGFMRSDRLVCVELHWDFLPKARSFPLTPDCAWSFCEDIVIGGTNVPSFAPEHILVFLCAHGAKHGWTRLKWIRDVAELARIQPDTGWERVLREAQRLRCERVLHLGLLLASELFEAKLPERVEISIRRDPEALSLANDVIERVASGSEEIQSWEESLFWIRSREDARDKIPGLVYFLGRSLVVPTWRDRAIVSLPRSLFFIYYFVRPMRLILERLGVGFDEIARDEAHRRTGDSPVADATDMPAPSQRVPGGEMHSPAPIGDS